MRIWLIFLLLPCLVHAGGCNCDDVEKQLKKEREEDTKAHGCRICKPVTPNANACPEYGYECEVAWPLTTNILHPSDHCVCSEARCVKTARLAFEKKIVYRMRCNNSEWIVGDKKADAVVCAKPCDKGACRASNPKASPDYRALKVTAATKESTCATGTCAPNNGMVAINADGKLIRPLTGTTQVTCTGEGIWKDGIVNEEFVMCNASPCGPSRCPSFIAGSGANTGEVIPLTITGKGAMCAVATCPGKFISMKPDGSEEDFVNGNEITCQNDGTWKDGSGTSHAYVMCQQPACKGDCYRAPPPPGSLPVGQEMTVAYRKDCSFSCALGESMFRSISGVPTSIPGATATCENGLYQLSPTLTALQIGCYKCDLADGPYEVATSSVKPTVTKCVLTCEEGYTLQYYIPESMTNSVTSLSRQFFPNFALWYDTERAFPVSERDYKIACSPKA